jgi:ABC-type lipoprotein export system ATPase subunit
MTDGPILHAENVRHTYRHGGVDEPVLHGLDLTINAGEFVVIMGPSGCGKTTLLNILGLMMAPTQAGRLEIAGQNALHLSEGRRAKLRRLALGFVFQRFNLLPTISIRENVSLPRRLARLSVDHQADELLTQVGLHGHAKKKPGQLSIGQQQRVAIARALANRPPLLLADEPTGNLDSASAADVMALLRQFHQQWGQTILMITHNEQLTDAADRVITMQDGMMHECCAD